MFVTACFKDDEVPKPYKPKDPVVMYDSAGDSLRVIDGLWVATLANAGRLDSLLVDEKLSITDLKINGRINGADIITLYQMLGKQDYPKEQRGKLVTLDLTDASLVRGGGYYYKEGGGEEYYTIEKLITPYLFYGCANLKSIKLPKDVTVIFSSAFQDCLSLTDIDIPDGVTEIGIAAFLGCRSLTDITLPDSLTVIRMYAFFNCTSFTDITVPENVTEIEKYAFCSCSSLTSITIPDGVAEIGNSAFNGCSSLTGVVVPESVRVIREYAFNGCSSLTSVTVPQGITEVEDEAFSGCIELDEFFCHAAYPPKIDSKSFERISESATLYVPQLTKASYQDSDWSSSFSRIVEME